MTHQVTDAAIAEDHEPERSRRVAETLLAMLSTVVNTVKQLGGKWIRPYLKQKLIDELNDLYMEEMNEKQLEAELIREAFEVIPGGRA